MRRISTALAATVLLAGAPLAAQQHPMHPAPKAEAPATAAQGMGGMMQQCMAMMGGPSAAMILHHRQDLALTAEQVQRLQTLAARDSAAAAPHMREGMAAHQAATQLLKAEHPDFAAYEAKLREAANHAILGHVAMARAHVEARAVLTPDQRTRLEKAMSRGMMGGGMGGMMGGGKGGMMGEGMSGMGGMTHGGMMMDCPMMGMMGGMQGTAAPPAQAKPPAHH